MVHAPLTPRIGSAAQRAEFVGGVLLLASVVLGGALEPGSLPPAHGVPVRQVLFAAALVVFALGIRRQGSLTARRPLGAVALMVLAGWTLLVAVLIEDVFTVDAASDWLLRFSLIAALVQFAAAFVAATEIARLGIVPRPWNRAPGWALLAVSLPWLVGQLLVRAAPHAASALAVVLLDVEGLVRTGVPVFLGVLAIVLATQPGADGVSPPSAES